MGKKSIYEWNMYGKWMKDSIKVEMWAGELGMFVRGVMRHGSMEVCKRKIKRGEGEIGMAMGNE